MVAPAGAVKAGSEIAVGDILGSARGEPRMVTRIEPYPDPHLFDFMDERWRIVYSGEWGMTVGPDEPWRLTSSGTWANAFHVKPDGSWVA